jgi:hypothetical protein
VTIAADAALIGPTRTSSRTLLACRVSRISIVVLAERYETRRLLGFDARAFPCRCDSGIERVDRGGLVTREFEVEDVEVLGDAGWFGGLRNCRATLL